MANTSSEQSTCTWLWSLFSRRGAHWFGSGVVWQNTFMCTRTRRHVSSETSAEPLWPTFWWRPLDEAQHIIVFIMCPSQLPQQLQLTRHAGSLVPVTLATSHSSADIPSSGLIFNLLLGLFVCVCVFVCMCVHICLHTLCDKKSCISTSWCSVTIAGRPTLSHWQKWCTSLH